jgi:hypothetical protein
LASVEKAAKIGDKVVKEMRKAMREKPYWREENMDRIEKERQKEPAGIQAEHEKVAANAGKESKKDHKHRQKIVEDIKANKKGYG